VSVCTRTVLDYLSDFKELLFAQSSFNSAPLEESTTYGNHGSKKCPNHCCWNYLYLSQLLGEANTEDRRADFVESIKHGSVVSWQHINLHGEYDFSDDKLQDSVGLDLPKIVGFLQGKKWEVKNRAKPVEQMSLPEIL
jgi:hypothetical protein